MNLTIKIEYKNNKLEKLITNFINDICVPGQKKENISLGYAVEEFFKNLEKLREFYKVEVSENLPGEINKKII